MNTTEVYKSELTSASLEAALPTLTAKLMELKAGLSGDELETFSKIINSAAGHLAKIQNNADLEDKLQYSKPISAQATVGVRNQILSLPDNLGLH